MIKLYELAGKDEAMRFSPYVWRVRLALQHKGLPFESVTCHFTDKAELEPANSKTVPVIKSGDDWVKDSFDICLYLDEMYREKPLIKDIALARFFNGWVNRTIVGGLFPMIACDVWSNLGDEDQIYFRTSREKYLGCTLEVARDKREAAAPAFLKSLSLVRGMLTKPGSKFLSGDEAGWSDYVVASNFIWARIISDFDVLESDGELTEWFDRMLDIYDGHARKAPTVHKWG